MDMWLLGLLVFLAAFFTVFAANALLLDLGTAERRRLNRELQEQLRQRERDRIKYHGVSRVERPVESQKRNLLRAWKDVVEQSGLDVTVPRILLASLGTAILMGLLCGLLASGVLLALTAAVIGATLPAAYVLYVRHQRLEKLLKQLPDAFDVMSRVLRSGQTVSQAMKLVADEFSAPLSVEFVHCHEQMNLGLPADAALHDLAQRLGLLEIKIFAVAVLVQRQTGGNLSELFDKLGAIVRERFRIRGLINSLTAQGRMQAVILASLPVCMFALMMVIQPAYESVLFDYPVMLTAAIGLVGLGSLWIYRITHFDY